MTKNIPDLAETAVQYRQAVASENTKEAKNIIQEAGPTFAKSVEAYAYDKTDHNFYDFQPVRQFVEEMKEQGIAEKMTVIHALSKLDELEKPFHEGVDYKRDSRLDPIPLIPETSKFHMELDPTNLLTITGQDEKGTETISYKTRQGNDGQVFEWINFRRYLGTPREEYHEYSTAGQPGKYNAKVNDDANSPGKAPNKVVAQIAQSMRALPKAYMASKESAGQVATLDTSRNGQ